MASLAKTVAGQVTTYTITDVKGNTIVFAVTSGLSTGITQTLSSTGAVCQDAMVVFASLVQQTMTNQLP
jgi:hypothetical protein